MGIAIKENLDQNVTKVEHRNARIMTMRIKTKYKENPHNPEFGRPDMRYATETRGEYWNQIKKILYQAKKEDIVIWETDNNGQINRNPENDDKTIGKWAIAKKTAKGAGRNSICNVATITSS